MPAKKGSTSKKKKRSSSSAAKKSTASKSSASKSTAKKATPKQPKRREIGAVVCLVLAVCSFLGYFSSDGWFIAFFHNLLGGLFGKGFYLVPPALLVCAFILFTHRGRPVRLRVVAALLFPLLFGALLHLFISEGSYSWTSGLLAKLYADGPKLGPAGSGGVLGGIVCMALVAVLGRIGTGIVLIVLLLVLLAAVSRVTPSALLERVRNRERVEYEYVPKPEKPKPEKVRVEVPVKEPEPAYPQHPVTSGRRRTIDFPIDEPTYPDYAEQPQEAPAEKPAKKEREKGSYFNRKPGVPTPDELLHVDAPKPAPSVTIQPSLTATRPPVTPMTPVDGERGAPSAAAAPARRRRRPLRPAARRRRRSRRRRRAPPSRRRSRLPPSSPPCLSSPPRPWSIALLRLRWGR